MKTRHKKKVIQDKRLASATTTVPIVCPSCSQQTPLSITKGISTLAINEELNKKIKLFKQPKQDLCSGFCNDQPATLYCEECNGELFCEPCFELQHKRPKLQNHNKASIGDHHSNPWHSMCDEHGKVLDMYCLSDSVACCSKCFQHGTHKHHKSVSLETVIPTILDELGDKMKEKMETIQTLKGAIIDIEEHKSKIEQEHKEFDKNVTDIFNSMIKKLELRKNSLLADSTRIASISISNMNLQCEALTDLLKEHEEILDQVNKWGNHKGLSVLRSKQAMSRLKPVQPHMLRCCDTGGIQTSIQTRRLEVEIDKLGSISKIDKKQNIDLHEATPKLPSEIMMQKTTQLDEGIVEEALKSASVESEQTQLLNLIQKKLSNIIYQRITQVISAELEQLDLNSCQIGDEDSTFIVQAFPLMTRLQKIVFHTNEMGDTGATAIAHTIETLTELYYLNLAHNRIGPIGATELANGLKGHINLQFLYLHSNPIGDNGAIAIANRLPDLLHLQYLYLESCQIGDKGVTAIANIIMELPEIQRLHVGLNEIGDTGAFALANILQKVKSLQNLYLNGNQITDNGAQALANNSRESGLKVLHLQQNNLSHKLKSSINDKRQMSIRVE